MASFKDSVGREWVVSLNVWLLEQVTTRATIDIDKLLDDSGKSLVALFSSSPKVARVLWVLIEEEAKKVGLTEEQFLRSLGGERLEDARHALYEAIADFYPPQDQKTMRVLGEKFWDGIRSKLASSSDAIGSPESSELILGQ